MWAICRSTTALRTPQLHDFAPQLQVFQSFRSSSSNYSTPGSRDCSEQPHDLHLPTSPHSMPSIHHTVSPRRGGGKWCLELERTVVFGDQDFLVQLICNAINLNSDYLTFRARTRLRNRGALKRAVSGHVGKTLEVRRGQDVSSLVMDVSRETREGLR